MLEVSTKKLAFKFLILTLLVLSLLFFWKDSTRTLLAPSQAAQDRGQEVHVLVASQEGSPLSILSSSVESAEPQNFKLKVMVQNQSGKEIRVYAITSETATDKKQNGYTDFINLTGRAGLWQPTEIRAIDVKDTPDGPVVSVRVAVDFVEFSDGTTWGPDANNSRDLLAGQREGARSERRRIRQLLKSKGRAAVAADIQATDVEEVEVPTDPNRSQKWLTGFRAGAAAMRGRLKRALQSGGAPRIELELDKPFDTSEKNRR